MTDTSEGATMDAKGTVNPADRPIASSGRPEPAGGPHASAATIDDLVSEAAKDLDPRLLVGAEAAIVRYLVKRTVEEFNRQHPGAQLIHPMRYSPETEDHLFRLAAETG